MGVLRLGDDDEENLLWKAGQPGKGGRRHLPGTSMKSLNKALHLSWQYVLLPILITECSGPSVFSPESRPTRSATGAAAGLALGLHRLL